MAPLSSHDRLPNIQKLIQKQSYVVLHALRQTSKSTAMLDLATEQTDSCRKSTAQED
jgi:DUF1680 family protein